MQSTINCLIKACELNDIPYQTLDRNGHCLMVDDQWFFQINRTPFNSESMAALCKDKEQQYMVLKDRVNMPKTLGFLDYTVKDKFAQYLKYPSIAAIIEAIEANFNYPLVIKQNRGALGINVFFCHDRQQVIDGIKQVFTRNQDYDYVVLAQQFIKPKLELRAIYFDGQPVLSYERCFDKNQFGARYWESEHGKALPLQDNQLLQQCTELFSAAVNLPGLRYVGLDILLDENDDLYLLELNSGPKVNHFIQSNGEAAVIEMYRKILNSI